MGKHIRSFGSGFVFLLQILSLFILLSCAKAENTTWPMANVNLSPIQAWRSAYYCLQNASKSCTTYTLNTTGWLNVTHADGPSFCKEGCADHIRAVLQCILYVKKDFWFGNKATVQHLNDTIDFGCNNPAGFNGTSFYPPSGSRINSAPYILALSASALLLVAFL
ncbi:unnamed protein product [Fraxinus pennsylvanica]|uniref:DUF7731 domain-containing protein n=1 Tax=Fraxinus pennsylvanica TaxID=56036 RepID=A0AAD2DQY9_9LAMI|nr:unnamed protein product [Fraxinus pennsylvanica]